MAGLLEFQISIISWNHVFFFECFSLSLSLSHTHTLGPTCRKDWLIPHLTVVILQLRKMPLNEAGLEHPLKKSTVVVWSVLNIQRPQQNVSSSNYSNLKSNWNQFKGQTNSCISINISIYRNLKLKQHLIPTSQLNPYFSISFISCSAEMGECSFYRLERLIAGDDVYRLGAWKTLKMWFRGSWCFFVATWDCDGLIPSYLVVVCVFYWNKDLVLWVGGLQPKSSGFSCSRCEKPGPWLHSNDRDLADSRSLAELLIQNATYGVGTFGGRVQSPFPLHCLSLYIYVCIPMNRMIII